MTDQQCFDYVIVGAGSAGCVLANRLSADPSVTVCLVEAGPADAGIFPGLFVRVPVGVINLIGNPKYNWMYELQSPGAAQSLPCPRGRLWGGSSAINGMVYIRGNRHDYDGWAAEGNRGWSYDDVLPLFKKSENFEPGPSEWHGSGGELNVAEQRCDSPVNQVFLEGARELGWPMNKDFNAGEQEGVGRYHVTQKNGERCSAARAFLHPVLGRPNLTVLSETLTHKVVLDGQRAVGIEVCSGGKTFRINAAREVILSAGAIASPQLLMLSGIGPREELEKHGIAVRHELPGVGRNLQDHQDVCLMFKSTPEMGYGWSLTGWAPLVTSPVQYIFRRNGPLTSNSVESGGFLRLDPASKTPDIQFHVAPALKNQPERTIPIGHGFSIHVCVLKPKSRGSLHLNSSNPMDRPELRANFLTHPDDMKTLVAGIRKVRELVSTRAFSECIKGELAPGMDVVSDEQVEQWARKNIGTVYHPVGTCKMGRDPMAVVDDELRVHGIEGLRVADASIMPRLIAGNTNAPATMIGEKAADLILHPPLSLMHDSPLLIEKSVAG